MQQKIYPLTLKDTSQWKIPTKSINVEQLAIMERKI